jgi:glycosyltransferase involved in cell wall biosynthesis
MDIRTNMKEVDFDFPINIIYAYDGYGRLGRAIASRIRTNPFSPYKIYLGSPGAGIFNPWHLQNKNILFTMFEADRIPDEWVRICNQASAIIVPSDFCVKSFKESGVIKPIYKLNLGTDCFDSVNPPEEPFVFGHQNSFVDGDQKGWVLTMKAFLNVFHKTPKDKVMLHLKGRKHRWANDTYYIKQALEQPNIKCTIKDLSHEEMDNWYERINCFVYPSRGEGFGLPPLESMARGIPTILTDAHSHREFSDYGIKIGTRGKCPTYYVGRVWHRGIGKWVEPDYAQLEEKMWDVYNNYQKYKVEALNRVPEIKKKFSWDTVIDNLIVLMEQIKNDI